MTFKLEDKYLVLSLKDLEALSSELDNNLVLIRRTVKVSRLERGAEPDPEYLVLKKGTAAYHAGLSALMLEVKR